MWDTGMWVVEGQFSEWFSGFRFRLSAPERSVFFFLRVTGPERGALSDPSVLVTSMSNCPHARGTFSAEENSATSVSRIRGKW